MEGRSIDVSCAEEFALMASAVVTASYRYLSRSLQKAKGPGPLDLFVIIPMAKVNLSAAGRGVIWLARNVQRWWENLGIAWGGMQLAELNDGGRRKTIGNLTATDSN